MNKPAGLLVQGDKTGDKTLIDAGKEYLREKYHKPGAIFLHPVHRIDRPVSGAVLMARTDKALGRLTQMFRDKKVVKTYLALVLNPPENQSGMLRHFLLKDEQKNMVTAYNSPYRDAKESITIYRVTFFNSYSFFLDHVTYSVIFHCVFNWKGIFGRFHKKINQPYY